MNKATTLSACLGVILSLVPILPTDAQEAKEASEGRRLLRKSEAYESLSRTNITVLTRLYQRYLAGAKRFGDKAEHARAFSQFFLGRCYLADSSGDRALKAFQGSRAAFAKLKEKEWVAAIDLTLAGLKEKRDLKAVYGATTALVADESTTRLKARDSLVTGFLGGQDMTDATEDDGHPDYELVVGETDLGSRKTEETIVFWDPIRARVRVWSFALKAISSKSLDKLEEIEALRLSGKNKAAWTLAKEQSGNKAKVLKGALQWRKGEKDEAKASWAAALEEDPSLLANILRRRALLGAVDEGLVQEIEAKLKTLKDEAGKGTVGLKRHLAKNRDLLWSLALLRRAVSRGTKRAGRDALAALSIAERQFPAGARGELYQHEDPRFPFVLGDLYITAHRFGDALSYVYDPGAVIREFPEAAATRKTIQELQLMEALTTDDAQLELDGQEEQNESSNIFQDYGELIEDTDVEKEKANKLPRFAPDSSYAAYIVLAVGLLLVVFAGLKLRRP
ncbi:MAG: hypothetical protein P1V97_02340 [Planctomycetota bacterium]|nr:hypothetical protein [Planctomycetota bacterium]